MRKHEVRLIRIEGQEAFVPLTQDKETVIDAADVPLVQHMNWIAVLYPDGDGRWYATGRVHVFTGYWDTVQFSHMLIQPKRGQYVDHIDGDGLNNRRSNIRVVSPSENSMNRRVSKLNTSGFKGVTLRSSGRWQAQIDSNGMAQHLGTYDTPEEAHMAYCAAGQRLYGEFFNAG